MEQVVQKSSNLGIPTKGYELDREKMSYVDGGVQIPMSGVKTDNSLEFTAGTIWTANASNTYKKVLQCQNEGLVFNIFKYVGAVMNYIVEVA